MPDLFSEDDELWAQSVLQIDEPIQLWSFSSNTFYIGKMGLKTSEFEDSRTAFELGLFDVHFTYWLARFEREKGYCRNYNYHARLRSKIETHFLRSNSAQLSPPILTPWLWRSLVMCPHTKAGRDQFKPMLTAGRWSFDTPPCSSWWHEVLKKSGFEVYLPTYLGVVKDRLGSPAIHDRLYCWELDVFTPFLPDPEPKKKPTVDIRRPLNFVPSSSRIFLTRRETIKKPWLRLQNDPTLQRKPKGRPLIAHSGLRRLRPGMELNCEIVDAYCDLCQSDPAAAPVKILPTHFWQLVKGGGRSYLSADKLLYAHLVGGSVPKKGELTFGIKKAISQLSSLLFPINYNESHWLLAKMEFHVKRVTLYDSLRSMTGPKGRKTISKDLVAYFKARNIVDSAKWDDQDVYSAPQQIGWTECGVYMCQFAKFECLNWALPSSVSPEDVRLWRSMMTLEVADGVLRC